MTSKLTRRAKILRRYEILDTTPEETFDAITKLASAICSTPLSAVSFLDADRQWFKSEVGLGIRETSLSESFCKYTVGQIGPMVITDASIDPRFMHNELVTSGPKVRFYAGCALRAKDGTGIGAICVLDTEPRPEGLSATERSTLEVLARQIEGQLELRVVMKEGEAQVAALRNLTKELAFRGSHDVLTALPNRGLFAANLQAGLDECDRNGTSLTLMILDVDHFKHTNDTLGHDAGDALLRGFAASLRSVIRATDTVARIGGDEFAIIITGVAADGPDWSIIEKLTRRIRRPISHRGRTMECQASIGLSTYPKDATNAEALGKCSDLALAAAKLQRGSVRIFEALMLDTFDTQLLSVEKVRASFAAGAFEPHYQPKINLSTGQRIGFEALMRWRGPGAGGLPNIFDPDFPDKSLVAQVSFHMIEKILDDAQRWSAAGIDIGHIAINTSAIDFASDNFGEQLISHLRARNISPKMIELEITESVFLGRGVHHIVRALRLLRSAGVRVALDDFGTGYASLTHLRQFPVDILKIDQSFVSGVTRNVDDAAIVRAVIGLAKNLEIVTVAEGIETSAQEAFVRHHGCDIGQGYLYGKAVPASKMDNETRRRHDVA